VSGVYEGRQIVGMDLHRRRSVLVRMTEDGELLETIGISNDPEYLGQVMARAGEDPQVVLEPTYGWYWAADTLAELGVQVHLAHPLGVKAFEYRRVKNDERDTKDWRICCGWAGCPTRGSPRPRPGSGSWCVIGRSWSACGHGARPRSTRCWPSGACRCR
jgi:hypothetical protein